MLHNFYLCSCFSFLWYCEYLFVVFLPWCRALSAEFWVGISELRRKFSFFKVHILFDFLSIKTLKVSGKDTLDALSKMRWKNAEFFFFCSFENLLGIHLVLTTWNVQEQISMKRSYNLFQQTQHKHKGKINNMHWVKACSFYEDGIANTCSIYVRVHPSQQS